MNFAVPVQMDIIPTTTTTIDSKRFLNFFGATDFDMRNRPKVMSFPFICSLKDAFTHQIIIKRRLLIVEFRFWKQIHL